MIIRFMAPLLFGTFLWAQTLDEVARHARTKPLTAAHLDLLERTLADNPSERKAFDLLVNHYYGLQNWGALIRLYDHLPNPADTDRITHGKLLIRDGRFSQAAQVLKPMADAQTNAEEINRLTGHALFYSRNPQDARPYLERVIEANVRAKRPDPLYMRGMLNFYKGDHNAAVADFKRVRTFAPEHVPTLNSLGRALAAAGKRDQAAGFLKQAAVLQARQTASEKQQLRLGATLRQLEQAWRAQDLSTAETLIEKLLPQADSNLKDKLTNMLIAVYNATGRQAEASALKANQ